MRTALYIRVSTQEQADEGHSISEQQDRMRKYCEAKGWDVINVYTDPGYSGSNTTRPALSKLISDIENSHFDMVLVYKLDRLSRSQKDTLFLIEDVFLKNNVDFVSMNENFDTSTPFGRAMIGILSVFAQLEREQIKERMAMGHVGRAKEGYWRGGSGSPIGYDFVDGKLIINEYEAMQVREIYNLFLEGNTLNGIATILKEKYTNRYSSWNNAATIGKILRNTTYIGKIRYIGKEYEGQHEPIVSKEMFDMVQVKYDEFSSKLSNHFKSPYKGKHLLSGIMFCGNCDARYFTYSVHSKERGIYYYYKCYSRDGNKEMKKMDGCKNPTYRLDVLNEKIKDEILELNMDKSKIEILRNKSLPKSDNHSEIITNRIVEIEKQISKLMDLYQLGTISIDDISNRINPLQKEKENLQNEFINIKKPTTSLSIEQTYDIISNAQVVFEKGTLEQQKNFINTLINKIVINKDGVDIYWKFCFM